jgi:hypothetical protein
MKYLQIILSILILSVIQVYAQTEFQFIGKLETNCDNLYADPLGNFYVISGQNIRKYDIHLDKIGDYSNAYLGNISFADVSDPLRILIYYMDFNQVVWLDNFLQELRSPIKLDDIGIDQAVLLCSSNLGGFWVFDQLNSQLQYFDKNLKKIHESISLGTLTGETKPAAIAEKNRMVFLYFPGSGILTFDQFATYSRTLPVFPDNSFQVTDESIYYLHDGSFIRYDLDTFREENLVLPDTDSLLTSVSVSSEYVYLHKKDGIFIYKFSYLYQ